MENCYSVINPYTLLEIEKSFYTSTLALNESVALLQSGKKKSRKISPYERFVILENLAKSLETNKQNLATLITEEMGKTITESLLEIDRAVNTVRFSAQEALRLTGEVMYSDVVSPRRHKKAMIEYVPIGIVLAITPFNFPINLAVHKIAPAFASGNVILFKPNPQNIRSATLLAKLCYDSGMREEYLQLINPQISDLSALIQSDAINCINFTGGPLTAKNIALHAGIKKLLLELGGNDPLIVMNDADLENATTVAIQQRFGTAGQRCTACKKIFLHHNIYQDFKLLLLEKVKQLVMGDPKNPETFIGPVVSNAAANEIMKRIQLSLQSGATLLFGNQRQGNIITPTILENVAQNSILLTDETFGPVMPLLKFHELSEVIADISNSRYGLQAGVFTQNLATIQLLHEELEVGSLIVNDGPGFRAEHFPFGGVKESGLGREGISFAMKEMSVIKSLVF